MLVVPAGHIVVVSGTPDTEGGGDAGHAIIYVTRLDALLLSSAILWQFIHAILCVCVCLKVRIVGSPLL